VSPHRHPDCSPNSSCQEHKSNGKDERFIQTLLREWAYARSYRTSNQRSRAPPGWLGYYNAQRPHAALAYQPPLAVLRRYW